MAFVYIDAEGNGFSIQETAAEFINRVEGDDEQLFVPALKATNEDEDPWRRVYIDKASIIAVEVGAGQREPAEEPAEDA